MKLLIDQLIVLDRAFYRYYLEMLLTLEHTHALTPWQMSILLWRAKIFHVEILYPELLRISIGNEGAGKGDDRVATKTVPRN